LLKSNIARRIATCAKSVLVGCVLLGGAGDAQAFVVKHSAQGMPVHWARKEVAFEIDPSAAQMAAGAEAAIAAAAQVWSGAGGAPTLSMTAAVSASQPAFDGKNVVYFAPKGYAPAGRALAITILTYNAATGDILDADVVINGRYRFDVLPSTATADPRTQPISNDGTTNPGGPTEASGKFDVQHVLAHEFGHALGMSDEPADQSAIMFLSTRPGDATVRTLAVDDLDGISTIYYVPPSGHGCSLNPPDRGGGRGNGTWTVALLFAAAVGLRIRSSGRRVGHALTPRSARRT
jgi:Matrixin